MPNGIAAKSAAKTRAEKAKSDKARAERRSNSFFSRMSRFLRESYVEVVKKAAWPSWPDLKRFTTVVIVAVVVVGIWIAGLDLVLSKLTHAIGFGATR